MSNIPNKDMKPKKGSLSPGRRREIPSATDEDRATAVYPNDNSNASVGLTRRITDNSSGPVKPSGKYGHNFEDPYGPTSGPTATTVYSNNPLLHNMFSTPEEEQLMREQGTNPNSDSNVRKLKADRTIPDDNKGTYKLSQRGDVASVASRPYEEAEYAKMSCWEKLMACFKSKKSKKNMVGGSIGGAGVTIQDLRDFLDANPDIKNILVNDECPLDPTEQMNNDADDFVNMLENYENPDITIDEIYNQDAGKRRKKTRKAKRRPRKTRKSKRRTKRRN
jgi:hypothetical protein